METILYGVDSSGSLVSIHDAKNGLACNLRCPACGDSLVAKNNGKERISHFAHKGTHECGAAYQSIIHLLAKELIAEHKAVFLPATAAFFGENYTSRQDIEHCFWCAMEKHTVVPVDDVVLERSDGDIIPDIIVTLGKRKVYIEIYVSHRVDDEKKKKLKSNGVSTLEINLSDIRRDLTREELVPVLESVLFEPHYVVPREYLSRIGYDIFGERFHFSKEKAQYLLDSGQDRLLSVYRMLWVYHHESFVMKNDVSTFTMENADFFPSFGSNNIEVYQCPRFLGRGECCSCPFFLTEKNGMVGCVYQVKDVFRRFFPDMKSYSYDWEIQ